MHRKWLPQQTIRPSAEITPTLLTANYNGFKRNAIVLLLLLYDSNCRNVKLTRKRQARSKGAMMSSLENKVNTHPRFKRILPAKIHTIQSFKALKNIYCLYPEICYGNSARGIPWEIIKGKLRLCINPELW